MAVQGDLTFLGAVPRHTVGAQRSSLWYRTRCGGRERRGDKLHWDSHIPV